MIEELERRQADSHLTPERYKKLLIAKLDNEDLADKLAASFMLKQIQQNQYVG
jgi:hypothetical protein